MISRARFDAVIFDMDGVITDTAELHAQAWKRLFDEFLATSAANQLQAPFSLDDYRRFVDGRARIDGVESFLASRGIRLARGTTQDPPDARSGWGLANRKNRYFLDALATQGAAPIAGSVAFVGQVRAAGLRTGLVTASRNREAILRATATTSLFDVVVDGNDAQTFGLAGKPEPAMFAEAARRLAVAPGRAVVVEDAYAGVEAGRRGGFGLVIGLDRHDQADELRAHGADVAVTDLSALTVNDAAGEAG